MEPSVFYQLLGLYIICMLLPLVPAVALFKLFPKTTATVKGPLSRLSIRAGGAFGAYIITVLLGFYQVGKFQERILNPIEELWWVRTDLQLLDENNQPIPDPRDDLKRLCIELNPALDDIQPTQIGVRTLRYSDKNFSATFQIPGYRTDRLDVTPDDWTDETRVERRRHTVSLKRPVKLIRNGGFPTGQYPGQIVSQPASVPGLPSKP